MIGKKYVSVIGKYSEYIVLCNESFESKLTLERAEQVLDTIAHREGD